MLLLLIDPRVKYDWITTCNLFLWYFINWVFN